MIEVKIIRRKSIRDVSSAWPAYFFSFIHINKNQQMTCIMLCSVLFVLKAVFDYFFNISVSLVDSCPIYVTLVDSCPIYVTVTMFYSHLF